MTFTILANNEDCFGIGTISGSISVGGRVPWIKEGIGAIATQGYTDIRYGRQGIKLLEEGCGPNQILERLTKEDPTPEKRQIAVLSTNGEKAVHTGVDCPSEKGSEIGKNCACVGNMLTSEEVISRMLDEFETAGGKFPERILGSLEAGLKAGGDSRGNRTGALLIRGEKRMDIRVGLSQSPLRVMRKKLDNV